MKKNVEVKCVKCGHIHTYEVDVNVKELTVYGFEKDTKGDFLSRLIFEKQVLTVNGLFEALAKHETYKADNNIGRLNSVINILKHKKLIAVDKGSIKVLVNPAVTSKDVKRK